MTPHDWIVKEHLRQQRRDAGLAFFIIAVVLVVLIGGTTLLVAWLEALI